MRLLLLEDDVKLRRSIRGCLRADGYAVDDVGTLGEAHGNLREAPYDGLVLDRLVPDGDSLDLVAELAASPDPPATLVMSGLGSTDDRVRGLEHGASDYMAKPVRLDELLLRVRRMVVRRTSERVAPITLGSVVVDRALHAVVVDGAEVHLTSHQYAVVAYLAGNRHRLVPSEELLDHCWDRNRELFANPLHTQITRLRRVFDGHLRFVSVRGVGYRIEVPSPPATPGS